MEAIYIPTSPSRDDLWYLVYCLPGRETYTARSMRELLRFSVFLPEYQIRLRGTVKSVPLFPGYLFISANLQVISKSRINSCNGVIRLVEFGGFPQAVPQSIIDTLSQRLSNLPECDQYPFRRFNPGDPVQVKNGPLQDLEMIFVSPMRSGARVRVLLQVLGRLKEVQIDEALLEQASVKPFHLQEASLQGTRRTRGKGRRIDVSLPQ